MNEDWFEVEDEVDDTQKTFLDVLRPYARSWVDCPPSHAIALVFDEDLKEGDEVEMRAVVDVSDAVGDRILLTLAASLVGNTMHCSEVHTQTYLPEESGDGVRVLEATGAPEDLARMAAAWFDEVLRRPVITPVGKRGWSFADPGRPLPEGFRLMRGEMPGPRA
ncbi:hypothetical protein ACWD48_06400 [Streptomyces sp. NPDC002519]